MPIQFFNEVKESSQTDVPYLEDYYKSHKDCLDKPFEVLKCIDASKGIVIVTKDWSSFIWKSSKDAKSLKEVMPLWIKDKKNKYSKFLVAVPFLKNYKGKQQVSIRLGIDTDLQNHWKYLGKAEDSMEVFDPTQDSMENSQSNPLLIPTQA